VLVLHGEQGSAKSTTARALRGLIDPHSMPLRAAPRDEQSLLVAAQNNWVVCLDNLSSLRVWQSDAVCRLATGGGFGTRKLYTNDEEVQIQVARPVTLNGIAAEMVNRSDLLDRAMTVALPVIPDTARRTEEDVWQELGQLRPLLLGALLDAASAGLRNLPGVTLPWLPRLADFVRWVEACGEALGWAPEEFLTTTERSRALADSQSLSLWPVYIPLFGLLGKGPLEHTVGGLLQRLRAQRHEDHAAWDPDWPASPRKLSADLRLYTPSLRRAGINVEWLSRNSQGQWVRISRDPAATRPVSVSA
jgi:hypothetical protein